MNFESEKLQSGVVADFNKVAVFLKGMSLAGIVFGVAQFIAAFFINMGTLSLFGSGLLGVVLGNIFGGLALYLASYWDAPNNPLYVKRP